MVSSQVELKKLPDLYGYSTKHRPLILHMYYICVKFLSPTIVLYETQ